MGKNVTLMGADYPDVPAVTLPQTGGGTATFYDVEVTDGDPTLNWGTRSKVGTVAGTDLHVTMPSNPSPTSDRQSTSTQWGQEKTITRPYNAGMLIFGGRNGLPFMVYIPNNTTEVAIINGEAISGVSVTQTSVTITPKASGYGSTLNIESWVLR